MDELGRQLSEAAKAFGSLESDVENLATVISAKSTADLRKAERRGLARDIALFVLTLLAIGAVIAGIGALTSANSTADDNKRNTDELACIIIGGTPNDPNRPIIAAFRAKYHCPPYNPSTAQSSYGTTATVTATATTTTTASPGTITITRSGAKVILAIPGPTTTRYRPGSTTTVYRKRPVRTRTVTKTCAVVAGGKCILPLRAQIVHKK